MSDSIFIAVTDSAFTKPYINWIIGDSNGRAELIAPRQIVGYRLFLDEETKLWSLYDDDGLGNGNCISGGDNGFTSLSRAMEYIASLLVDRF